MKSTKKSPEKPPKRIVTKTKKVSETPEKRMYVTEKQVIRGNVSKTKYENETFTPSTFNLVRSKEKVKLPKTLGVGGSAKKKVETYSSNDSTGNSSATYEKEKSRGATRLRGGRSVSSKVTYNYNSEGRATPVKKREVTTTPRLKRK
jgi:hypothetical protein